MIESRIIAAGPQEVPPGSSAQPSVPPLGVPPANPGPDIPAPAENPVEPKQPSDLPGTAPQEVPVREPDTPQAPLPLRDAA